METMSPVPPHPSPETLALAQEAFRRFRVQCFWYLRPDLEVRPENLPAIIRGLRLHGGHAGWELAARLCR